MSPLSILLSSQSQYSFFTYDVSTEVHIYTATPWAQPLDTCCEKHLYPMHELYLYLASSTEIDSPLLDWFSDLPHISTFGVLICMKNAGFFGIGRVMVSFLSMETTSDMEGLSIALSCTHKRPTCMHLITSLRSQDSSNVGSSISKTVPSCHSSHAWYKKVSYT